MEESEDLRTSKWSFVGLAMLSMLACIEKLGSVLNTISIERDWVIIVAHNHEETLRRELMCTNWTAHCLISVCVGMNSQMRRIDLFCKLLGPLAIAFLDEYSSRTAIVATGVLTLASLPVEYYTIFHVYSNVASLRHPRTLPARRSGRIGVYAMITSYMAKTKTYFRHPASLPSIALALLHFTVLSFSGQMITYLVALGTPSGMVGVLRAASAVFELATTWFAPIIMSRIGPIRAGIWFLNWEIVCLMAAVLVLWSDLGPVATAAGLVSAVVVSRIGLWGYGKKSQ